ALLGLASLEFSRTDLAEGRMSAALVIEHLDIVEQLHLVVAAAREAIRRLTLDRRKERFHHRVVVAVAAAAHRARNPIRIQHPLIVFAGTQYALVRMMEQHRVKK